MTFYLLAPASTRKLERGDDIQIERTTLELHKMQISDHRYLEKVFKKLRQKLDQKLDQRSVSRGTGKPVRGIDNQLGRTRSEYHNM